jgi:hypothetical protein
MIERLIEQTQKQATADFIKIIDEYDFEGWLDNECCKLIRKELKQELNK